MGMLIEGNWSTKWYEPDELGRFVRGQTQFRERLSEDGSTAYPAEAGRYHLYVSLACPWAHRTLIVRKLRKLESAVSVSIVDPFMGDEGWKFSTTSGAIPDTVNDAKYLREIYAKARPDYTGRVTVPVLWDTRADTIVNNESREIVRMFDELTRLGDPRVSFLPEGREAEVDAMIDAIYEPINNGVYRAGFATTQRAYEEAVADVFDAMDHYDALLANQRYLLGNEITEADWFLFTTLFRFDPVYHYHFKCNRRRLRDYEHLWGYVRDLYQVPGVAETCSIDHIKRHYFGSHESINPSRIVPVGPDIDYTTPHDRARFG
jgi:putative glutathione S-transferase